MQQTAAMIIPAAEKNISAAAVIAAVLSMIIRFESRKRWKFPIKKNIVVAARYRKRKRTVLLVRIKTSDGG